MTDAAETKHTPGPWTSWDNDGEIRIGIAPPGGRRITLCEISGRATTTVEEDEANARLIEAAPDLLKALIELMHETDRGSDLCGREFADAADRAIAKALGN